jgi:Fuc2NAc and GlcNAc transferase
MQIAWVLLAALVALGCCGAYLALARRWQILDLPNERSAHTQPTPRGGGIGLFIGLVVSMAAMSLQGQAWPWPVWQLLMAASVLVVVGAIEDRKGLPVGIRFCLYTLISLTVSYLLLGSASIWLLLPAALYLLWMMNLFNFMDGIDGIAVSETIFVCLAVAGLVAWQGGDATYALLCLLVAGAACGFLYWNWSPARLFMGDAGSISLGFLLAALSLLGQLSGALPLLCWLILMAVFIADASGTLLRRALAGERVTEALSSHLYQRLARHWRSHRLVVWLMLGYNLLWLLPLAMVALAWSQWQWPALAAAYLPLLLALIKAVKLP